ncbi:hypothetical protein ACHAXN_000902 [Cyclotella atomus]
MATVIYFVTILTLSIIDSAHGGKLFGVASHQRVRAQIVPLRESGVKIRRKRPRQETECNISDSDLVSNREYIRLNSLLQIIRAGGDASTHNKQNAKSKASKSSPTKGLRAKKSIKRGTRTTGAGASKRNSSIFSKQTEDAASKSWTAAALAGDVLNRRSTDELEEKNPMIGRLWAKQSDQGTLILKLPPERGNERDIYVELSERNSNSTMPLSELHAGSDSTRQRVSIEQITKEATTKRLTESKNDPFIPLEGIYGIYDLPCSGPHAVLITESEEIYTSPLSTTQTAKSVPLLELRRIKSLEIVSLRSKLHQESESNTSNKSSDDQYAEEARQLRLLRNSFKEHDFYFTVPRHLDPKQSRVVQDVTHPLQRMFLDWTAENRIRTTTTQGARQHWWTPYARPSEINLRKHMVDPRFFWNEQPALTLFRASATPLRLLDTIIPVTSAFVGVERNVPIPCSDKSTNSHEAYDQILISRRSKYRTGTRFTRRGADDTGAVANYAETEQICLVTTSNNPADESCRKLSEIYSHVQTRGSIPLHWSSPADVKAYRPRVFIGIDPTTQARGLRDHLIGELWWYASSVPMKSIDNDNQQVKLAMVNLIDKHGDQGRLGNTFDAVLSAVLDVYESNPANSDSDTKQLLHPKVVKHVWYDFHANCKGGRWDKLSNLLDEVSPILSDHAYFCAIPIDEPSAQTDQWKIISIQDGVVRTNCMDCLDRTNVVQSMFGRFMLYKIFHERTGLAALAKRNNARKRPLPLEHVVGFKQRPLCLPWSEGETSHRHLWADNADAISRLYAGTPALKGDFTRTGKRTKRGALDDGVNSIQRYYLNNFIDADRQEGMDLLVGSAEFNEYPNEQDDMSRVFLLQELADERRRGYEKSHVSLKSSLHSSQEGDSRKLTLSWLPGDLRHHMKVEALQSRSPWSSAASEEELHNAKKSSEFLLKVSAGSAVTQHSSTDSFNVLHSIDKRVASDKPWWAVDDDDRSNDGSDSIHAPSQRARLAAILVLSKAPVITAALLAVITSFNRVTE